jgi:class 3 adenylate cyclase
VTVEDAGSHELKGLTGPRQVFRVEVDGVRGQSDKEALAR